MPHSPLSTHARARDALIKANPALGGTSGTVVRLSSIAKQIHDCEAKSTFRTRGKALRFIDRSGYPLAPYRCVVCGEWHLTKEGKGER